MAMVFTAIAFGSLLKGITGLGLPVVALPVLSYFLGLPHAIGVLAIPILITNLHQTVQTRTAWREVRFLWPGLPGGIVGLLVGVWFLTIMSPERLSLGIGIMLMIYISLKVFSPSFAFSQQAAYRLSPLAGFLGGFAQGATGLCAAVIVPFIQSINISRTAIIFTISTVFLIFSMVQLSALAYAGLLELHYIFEGFLAMLPVVIFMPFGNWLGKKISRAVFDRVFLVILGVIAIGLIQHAIW